MLAYYAWVLHLSLASPLQLLRFKLRAGRKGLETVCELEDRVQLFVYDLSNGLARRLSPVLLNKQVSKGVLIGGSCKRNLTKQRLCCAQIQGVWHTAIVVGGLEYYYGCGVNQSSPGLTPFGRPVQVIDLGYARILCTSSKS